MAKDVGSIALGGLLALALVHGSGCTTARYLLEQGAGQLRIFHRREHVDTLLRRRKLPPGGAVGSSYCAAPAPMPSM